MAATVAVAALTAFTPATSSTAAPAAPLNVTADAVFNDPLDTTRQDTIKQKLLQLIDATREGSEIHGSVYKFTDNDIRDALLAAAARKVKVKMIVDGDNRTLAGGESGRLGELNSDAYPGSSFLECPDNRGCVANRTDVTAVPGGKSSPINHNKFFVFSETGATRNVVFQTTGNLTASQQTNYHNSAVVLPDADLYRHYRDRWERLSVHGRPEGSGLRSDYVEAPSTTGPYRVAFFPRAETDGTAWHADPATDTVVQILRNVGCARPAGTHDTRIRIAMFAFTRPQVADELVRLRKAGCQVYVYVNDVATSDAPGPALSDAVKSILLTGKFNQLRLCKAPALPGLALTEVGVHTKDLLIEGTYGGDTDASVVFTGSHNYTFPNLRGNDEALLKISDPAVYAKFEHNFDEVLDGDDGGICGTDVK
ncbi:phospholipase D-like domain-containing protein [Streptomyces sp. NPDC097619]|uniref:phospholipase D-like domain-containing protein n=1 Tax=Streptomyces sp. NPDC097619 TaxID=3157228 RepID=UPI00332AF2FB